MKAIHKFGGIKTAIVVDRPYPKEKEGYSIIKVVVAAVCRTDVWVSEGKIGDGGVTLGHEVAATVVQSDVFQVGDWVTVNPLAVDGESVGVNVDGIYSEYASIRNECLVECNRVMEAYGDPRCVAMIEPMSAYISPVEVITDKNALIGIVGEGRIADTTEDVLKLMGYVNTEEAIDEIVEDGVLVGFKRYDYLIVTSEPDYYTNRIIEDCLKKGGTVIYKCRANSSWTINPMALMKLNANFKFTHYMSFEDTIDVMVNSIPKEYFVGDDGLFGDTYKFNNFEAAFSGGVNGDKKVFLTVA